MTMNQFPLPENSNLLLMNQFFVQVRTLTTLTSIQFNRYKTVNIMNYEPIIMRLINYSDNNMKM